MQHFLVRNPSVGETMGTLSVPTDHGPVGIRHSAYGSAPGSYQLVSPIKGDPYWRIVQCEVPFIRGSAALFHDVMHQLVKYMVGYDKAVPLTQILLPKLVFNLITHDEFETYEALELKLPFLRIVEITPENST